LKFNHLRIENITSLRGIHTIDLSQLSDYDNLFAITGQMGSGKSSILMAISLALYGKTPLSKTALRPIDLVSLGSQQGSIILDFSIGEKNYTAIWKCKVLKKDGSPLKNATPTQLLYQGDTVLEVLPAKIMNLSFDQFSRSVILNQGEFSDFLGRKFKDRRDILEELSHCHQLKVIEERLRESLKNCDGKVEQLKSNMDVALPYSAQLRKDYQDQLTDLTKRQKNYSKLTPTISYIDKGLKDLKKMRNDLESVQQTKQKAQSELSSTQELFIYHSKDLEIKRKSKEKIEQECREKIPQYSKKEEKLSLLHSLKGREQKLQHSLLETAEEKELIQKNTLLEKEQLQKSIDKLHQLDQEFLREKITPDLESWSQLEKISKNYQIIQKRKEQCLLELDRGSSRLEDLQQEINKINQSLAQYSSYSTDEINSYKLRLTSLERHFLQLESSKNQLSSLIKQQKELVHERDILAPQLQEQEMNLLKEEVLLNEEKYQQEKYILEQKNRQLEVHIHQLKNDGHKNDQCPLCHHSPWIGPPLEDSKLSAPSTPPLDQYSLEEKEKKLYKIKQNLTVSKTNQSNIIQQIIELDNTIRDTSLVSYSPGNQQSLLERIESEEKWLKTLIKRQSDRVNYLTQKTLKAEHQQAILKDKLKNYAQEKSKQDGYLSSHQELILQGENILLDVPLESSRKFIFSLDLYYQTKEKVQIYHGELAKKNKSQNQNHLLESRLQRNHQQTQSISDDLSEIKHQLVEVSKQTEGHTISSIKKLISDLERQRNEAHSLFDKASQSLREIELKKNSLEESSRFSTERLKQIELLLANTWEKISSSFHLLAESDLGQSFPSAEALFTNLRKVKGDNFYHALKSPQVWSHFESDLWPKFADDYTLKLKEIEKLHSEILGKCQIYDDKEQQRKEIEDKLLAARQKYAKLKSLEQIIGKNALKNFILSEMERTLLAQANIELGQLCEGRYQLKLKKATHGSEYYIQDFWNSGIERKVSTLSGGETFMVSLALSLALAELSRGQTKIDSFFIDEGFGSLDDDSISEVLEVLNRIKGRGKQIGIISHVKKLTDQIPLNLGLSKSPSGQSTIQTIFN